MNAAVARDDDYAYTHSSARQSYAGRQRTASAFVAAPAPPRPTYRFTGAVAYVAPAEALHHGPTLPLGRLVLTGGVLLVLAVAGVILAGNLRGAAAAGLRLSGYQGLGPAVALAAAGLVGPTAPQAPAARPARPADAARPVVAAHTPNFSVVAPPSVSADLINRVLDSYHSPAAGSGALFYDLGVKYGIDPAYALAFYIHESAAGTKGVARFTHGIGNIRTTPGYADYEGYRSYPTYAAGIEDWYKLIKELYVDGWGLTTPDSILLRYAPWGDNNNPEVYAANVEQMVASWAGQ